MSMQPQSPCSKHYSSISSTGGLAVCTGSVFGFSSSTSLSSSVSSITAGNAGLSPCTFGSYIKVELLLRAFPGDADDGDGPSSEIPDNAADRAVFSLCKSSDVYCIFVSSTGEASGVSILPVSFCSLLARSSAWTSLFGGSSCRISQPTGGDGGGEMKNSLPASGRSRYLVLLSIGVGSPK